jgi:hypothetical protein
MDMRTRKTVMFAALAVLAAGAASRAVAAPPDPAKAKAKAGAKTAAPIKEPLQIPRLTKAPKIDGVLDNPIWETEALKLENFVQLTPKENGVPSEKTVAYLGYDEKNLYVAFRAYDTQSSKVRCSITKRDGCMEDDWVFIMLDTFNEKRRAFSFLINPIGIQMDMMRIEEGGNDNMDDSWDTVFLSDGKVDAEGYTVEMAIPFKSLRFPTTTSRPGTSSSAGTSPGRARSSSTPITRATSPAFFPTAGSSPSQAPSNGAATSRSCPF